ncbi:MAG: Tn3 family transposase [Actinoallomurus sp.]
MLEQLHRALNRRDVFASPSHRWSDPRARLLDGTEWEAVREDVLAGLSLDMPVEEHLAELVRGLDAGWKLLAERLAEAGPAAKVSIETTESGRVKLNVDKLGALGLVLNAVVLWTTRYIDAAVAQLRAEGHEIRDEDIARLSPLKHRNLNVLGRYSFTASNPAGGDLRPLRDPDAPELDEDEIGAE